MCFEELDKLLIEYKEIINRFNLSENKEKLKSKFLRKNAKLFEIKPEELKRRLIWHHVENYINGKENIRHYHRTSFSRLEKVLKDGALFSVSYLEKRGEDVSNLRNKGRGIQFSKDNYSADGTFCTGLLAMPHVTQGEDAVLVFLPSIMFAEGYDCLLGNYPEIKEKLPLKNNLESILIKDLEKISEVKELLKNYGFGNLPVLDYNEFKNTGKFQENIVRKKLYQERIDSHYNRNENDHALFRITKK